MPNAIELVRSSSRRPARAERQLEATLRAAQLPGQRAAAKIQAGALTTHVALSHTAMLSAAEERAIRYAPLGEHRYKAIVDSFTGYCCEEISLLAFA
jgi:hypothetical protein